MRKVVIAYSLENNERTRKVQSRKSVINRIFLLMGVSSSTLTSMKALVLEENARLVYKDAEFPAEYADNLYLIHVHSAGICGSDIHRGFEGGAYHYPLIMGHEFSGIVERSPSGGKYETGQRVTVFPLIPCRKCRACQTGDFAQCRDYDYLGSRRDGAFAEFLWAPEENLFPLPDHVDIVHAAMTEPCAVSLHGVRKLTIRGGETAAVYGAGPIGNMVAQWLLIRGCRRVIVIDVDEKKLAIARTMGFTTLNPKETDPVKKIHDLTRGEGAEIAAEAVGLPLTYTQALQSTCLQGEVLLLGNISGDLVVGMKDVSNILRKEITIYGTWNSKVVPAGTDDWSTTLSYMDRELVLGPLISHTPSLSEGPDIFRRILGRKEFFNKVIFRIGA
jgi:L-iditol 2-dehydrogenase/galactitol-1-phosphate 5-dehydrogenase